MVRPHSSTAGSSIAGASTANSGGGIRSSACTNELVLDSRRKIAGISAFSGTREVHRQPTNLEARPPFGDWERVRAYVRPLVSLLV